MLATDLYLGAFAMTRGAALKRVVVSRTNGKATAVFELEGPGLDELVEQYLLGTAVVNVAAYREQLTALRDELFGAMRRSENENRNPEPTKRRTDAEDRSSRARGLEARR